ncbi:MAG: DUF3857 domain-containing protein [bacterium]|nr:DUF3857 domain-containing protein [bacterium]
MTMTRVFKLSLTLFAWLASASIAFASVEDGWRLLLDNRFAEADAAFAAASEHAPNEAALRGRLLAAWARGDDPAAAEALTALIENFPASPCLPAYLAFCSQPNLMGWSHAGREQAVRRALTQTMPAANHARLQFELMQSMEALIDKAAGAAAREAGVIIDEWNVVGPFGRHGAADFFTPFGPEVSWSPIYDGWADRVDIHPVGQADEVGTLDLDGLVYPSEGVAYLINAIESPREQGVELSILSPADVRVWVNGEPLMQKTRLALHSANALSAKTRLKQGKNLIAVKLLRTDGWHLRAQLRPLGGEAVEFHSIPFALTDWRNLYLTPFETTGRLDETCDGLKPDYPFELPSGDSTSQRIENALLRAFWHLDRYELAAARDAAREASAAAPDFVLPYSLMGDIALRQAKDRPGSSSRFQQEAEEAFRAALDRAPNLLPALIGMQTYLLDRDQTDAAMALIDRYPPMQYTGRADYVAGVVYAKKGFTAETAQRFEKARQGFPPSFDVITRLFDYYKANRADKEARELIASGLEIYPSFLSFIQRANQLDEAPSGGADPEPRLKALIEMHPNSPQYAFQLATCYENAGRLDDAMALYGEMQKRFSNHPQVAERIASLNMVRGKRDKALEEYSAIHQTEPLWMEPFRLLRDSGDREFAYQKYDVSLDDVNVEDAQRWKNSRGSSIYLLDIMVLEYHEDGTYDMYVHQAVQVLNQQGVQKWAEVVIPKGPNVEIIKGRTITPDGLEWAVSHVQDLSGQQSLSMYGLEEGGVIEYAYLQRGGRDDPGVRAHTGGYFFGSDDDPMLLSQLTLIAPADLPLNFDRHPVDFDPEISVDNGRKVYVWTNRLQDGLKPERFAPPLAQRVKSVQWTTGADWLTLAERYRASRLGYQEDSDEVRARTDELTKDAGSKHEIIERIYNWIRESIEDSAGGSTTADTVKLKAGGRYQKLRLMRHMLSLAGVKTQMVYALEGEKDDGTHPLPYPAYPGSLLLRIPEQDGVAEPILVDFASRFAPLGEVGPHEKKQLALVFDGVVPYFYPLMPKIWEQGLLIRQAEMTFNDDLTAQVSGDYEFGYLYDQQIRQALTNPEVRNRLADAQTSSDFRGIQLDSAGFEDTEDLAKTPRLVFKGTMPDAAKPDQNGSFHIEPVIVRSEASGLVSDATRQFPIKFDASPVQDHFEMRFDLSNWLKQGARIQLPDNALLISDFGFYSLYFAWDGDDVVMRRSFLIPSQTIETDDYPRFVEFCRSIDQIEDRVIRVYPAS